MQQTLLKSAWRFIYKDQKIDAVAPASDRKKFEQSFEDPPEFTKDNIRLTFGKYIADPRTQILRGLAECFCSLDPYYKSHDKMKIGAKGLPKRIIISGFGGYGSYGRDKMRDVINALATLQEKPQVSGEELDALTDDGEALRYSREIPDPQETRWQKKAREEAGTPAPMIKIVGRDVWLKTFSNGNGHLFFGEDALRDINAALAEYYGDVLPDCPEAAPNKREASTEVAKDLQFYRTPEATADFLVSICDPKAESRILEPSCGDGAILDAIRRFAVKTARSIRVSGIEYDSARADEARAKGYGVFVANFLQVPPEPTFDYVLMNPPFYGKHYQQHVEHALKFLKQGGVLYAILPVTAVTDHGFVEDARGWDKWRDLPIGSFAESGTNINTGIARFFAPKS